MTKRLICLVTGGAGFIGSHLCQQLLKLGHTVLCLDNLLTGKKKNIRHLFKKNNFTFINDDVLNLKKHYLKPDYIFHLASPASPRWYIRYPVETIMVNTYGTYLLLELAKKRSCSFLFVSTSEVYGDPKVHPQKESYWGNVNPIGPRSCYDEAKRCGESLVFSYMMKTARIDARVVRIFNTYGPRMDKDDGRVVSNFIYQLMKNKPLTIHGDGEQTRSFCYISDMVEGILKAAFTSGLKGEVINLGNPQEISINKLAHLLAKITKKKPQFTYKMLPQDDPRQRCPSIEKAKKLLNWYPKVELAQGLKKTVKFFQKEYL